MCITLGAYNIRTRSRHFQAAIPLGMVLQENHSRSELWTLRKLLIKRFIIAEFVLQWRGKAEIYRIVRLLYSTIRPDIQSPGIRDKPTCISANIDDDSSVDESSDRCPFTASSDHCPFTASSDRCPFTASSQIIEQSYNKIIDMIKFFIRKYPCIPLFIVIPEISQNLERSCRSFYFERPMFYDCLQTFLQLKRYITATNDHINCHLP